MAQKRCSGCGQYAGAGHRCVARAMPRAMATPKRSRKEAKATATATSTAAATPNRSVSHPYRPLVAGEAARLADSVQRALRAPVDMADRWVLRQEREAIEARFGAIDWAS